LPTNYYLEQHASAHEPDTCSEHEPVYRATGRNVDPCCWQKLVVDDEPDDDRSESHVTRLAEPVTQQIAWQFKLLKQLVVLCALINPPRSLHAGLLGSVIVDAHVWHVRCTTVLQQVALSDETHVRPAHVGTGVVVTRVHPEGHVRPVPKKPASQGAAAVQQVLQSVAVLHVAPAQSALPLTLYDSPVLELAFGSVAWHTAADAKADEQAARTGQQTPASLVRLHVVPAQ